MQQAIDDISHQFSQSLDQAISAAQVEEVKVKYFGRKGPIQDLMKELRQVSNEQKAVFGKVINDLKEELLAKLESKYNELTAAEEAKKILAEKIDITLPGKRLRMGRSHPISATMDKLVEVMIGMGFTVQTGPEVDSDYYNFQVLNFPPDHPARDMQDTFYISAGELLRTHTSNVQARVMQKHTPPIRIVAPGKVYRNESITARSHVFFHQVEALYVDKNVSFTDLLSTLNEFLMRLFGQSVEVRYRPSYFPFVEPGLEVDINCLICEGKGCGMCKHSGWLEVAGAGMVHPNVLSQVGIDPEVYSGFAWGLGVERLVIMLNKVSDIRLFAENDLRFLSQFVF